VVWKVRIAIDSLFWKVQMVNRLKIVKRETAAVRNAPSSSAVSNTDSALSMDIKQKLWATMKISNPLKRKLWCKSYYLDEELCRCKKFAILNSFLQQPFAVQLLYLKLSKSLGSKATHTCTRKEKEIKSERMGNLLLISDQSDGGRQSLSVMTNRSRTKQWGWCSVADTATQHDYGIYEFGWASGAEEGIGGG